MNSFSPIIATSSLKHADFLKSLGATHVLDRALPAPVLVRAQRADNAGDNACRLQPALPALAPACPAQGASPGPRGARAALFCAISDM